MDNKIGKENESVEISIKNMKQAVHFPATSNAQLTGADKKVSNVPNLLSSANDLIVIKGIKAGDPNNKPTTKEDSGGKIQSVLEKLSIKNLNPSASNDKK
jgi:hypothetical protein